jgi:hypothetical protein
MPTAWGTREATIPSTLQLDAGGDVQLFGLARAVDAGADLSITADAQVLIDGLVTAPDDISITAGTVSSGYALIVLPTIMEGTPEQRVSGGEIRTAAGGSIELRATGGILLRGSIGSSTIERWR